MIHIQIWSDRRGEGKTTIAAMLRWFLCNFTNYNVKFEERGIKNHSQQKMLDKLAEDFTPLRMRSYDIRTVSIEVDNPDT